MEELVFKMAVIVSLLLAASGTKFISTRVTPKGVETRVVDLTAPLIIIPSVVVLLVYIGYDFHHNLLCNIIILIGKII